LNNGNILSQVNFIPRFTTAHELLEDKFSIEISQDKNKKKVIELTLGDKVCFVKPHNTDDLVCDTIVRGHLPKRYNGGLESPTVYVLVTDNKFDFYNITEIANKWQILDRVLENTIVRRFFTIYQLAEFLIKDLQKDIQKYKSKLVIITGEFYLSDTQITKQDKDWLYYQMIEAIKKITDSIIIVFSPITLPNFVNYY
jgi:hypothetical protein